jgi:hypothetical protein
VTGGGKLYRINENDPFCGHLEIRLLIQGKAEKGTSFVVVASVFSALAGLPATNGSTNTLHGD